ncbi:uncharacterized protein H6S33_006812 [Morchella sextelata]|uniref:uncharacterized protein n=1 Tax=Morchella sextelata TaxID=1174677 RepID=UPI001D040F20|nr:uncharacterized protein H6S33_006812 [Morchella sextelata]KAH0604435.1 hypothetical protein H6S33_006812 [Morchella sextelata]
MQFHLLTLALSLLALTHAHPTLTPRADTNTYTCTTLKSSPLISHLPDLGTLKTFPDGNGFCLTAARLCRGQSSIWCEQKRGTVVGVQLARGGTMLVQAFGHLENMQIRCDDLRRGIEELVSRCGKDGNVAGKVKFVGNEGQGDVTVELTGW